MEQESSGPTGGLDLTEELKDLNNSFAYNVLETMFKEGSLSKNTTELYKIKYGRVHEGVLGAYENEKKFLKRAKDLNHRLMSEKIRLEKTQLSMQEDASALSLLQEDEEKVKEEYKNVGERDTMLTMQIAELENERKDLEAKFEERHHLANVETQPQLERAREDVEMTLKEIGALEDQKNNITVLCDEYVNKEEEIKEELETNNMILGQHEKEYKKIHADPDRVRKQAEKFKSAVKLQLNLKQNVETELAEKEIKLKGLLDQKKLRDDQRQKLKNRLNTINDHVQLCSLTTSDAKKKMEKERNAGTELQQKKLAMHMEISQLSEELRHKIEENATESKSFDRNRREYRRKEGINKAVESTLPAIKGQIFDSQNFNDIIFKDQKRQIIMTDEIQNEVDIFISAFIKQEGLEKEKKDGYRRAQEMIEEQQNELKQLKLQEKQWVAHFNFLTQQREALARDATTAHRLCRETWDEVQMKELAEFDVKKKLYEITMKQKEFCTAYEVVKNERNKYVAMIQSSAQHLSEMKENLRILQNEVEILRMESTGKDKALQNTRLQGQRQRVRRDQLRTEQAKVTTQSVKMNEEVERHVNEIDNLNSIIAAIEKEMVLLKKTHEQVIETRNFTGIQLIDRNDELCILWEKANLQEKVLQAGEESHREKSEYLRILKLDLAEVTRQLRVVQRDIPEVPKLQAKHVELQEMLKRVREDSEALSMELETGQGQGGQNQRQWRHLGGTDPDVETLNQKVTFLDLRLNEKMEKLLEKELILEEVTALSDKLKKQALEGRQDTLDLSQAVNNFQAKIKEVTRKMMAMVSELSMYQATAMKLEQEREEICATVLKARHNMEEGLPPTDEAPTEYARMSAMDKQKAEDMQIAQQRRMEEDVLNSNATRTTAEPRVNAYVPDGDIGLPKAYGANTPFMPSTQGTTMRHIRKPESRPVEV